MSFVVFFFRETIELNGKVERYKYTHVLDFVEIHDFMDWYRGREFLATFVNVGIAMSFAPSPYIITIILGGIKTTIKD